MMQETLHNILICYMNVFSRHIFFLKEMYDKVSKDEKHISSKDINQGMIWCRSQLLQGYIIFFKLVCITQIVRNFRSGEGRV